MNILRIQEGNAKSFLNLISIFVVALLYCGLKLNTTPGVIQPFWNFNWSFLPASSSSTGKCFSPVRRNSDFLVLCSTFWGLPEVCFPSWSYKYSFPLMQKSCNFPLQALEAGRSGGLMAFPWWQAGNGAEGGGEEWTCVSSLCQLYFQMACMIKRVLKYQLNKMRYLFCSLVGYFGSPNKPQRN